MSTQRANALQRQVMNSEYSAYRFQRGEARVECSEGEKQGAMPVVKMNDLWPEVSLVDIGGGRGTEKCELGGIRRERIGCAIVAIDDASTLGREQYVLQRYMFHPFVGAGNSVDIHRVPGTCERNVNSRPSLGTGDIVEHSVGRCHYGWCPATLGERHRQIAYDVADAANLATGQRAILRGQ